MIINFSIERQNIYRFDNEKIAANSKGILYAEFEFDSTWEGLVKKAVFERNRKAYSVLITEGKCLVPEEVLGEGGFYISVIGINAGESIRATTEAEFVEVTKGPSLEQENAAVPTPTEAEQLTTLAGKAFEIAQEVKKELEEAEKGEISEESLGAAVESYLNNNPVVGEKGEKGDKGDPGYTPIRGTDYWTSDDVSAMQADNKDYIASELAKRGQLKPEFANDISECTDTTKLYVLPDGFIYAYMKHRIQTTTSFDLPSSANGIYRKSGGGYAENTGAGCYTINPPISLYENGERLYDRLEVTLRMGINFYGLIFLNNGTVLTNDTYTGASKLGTDNLESYTIDLSYPLYADATHFAISTTRPADSYCRAITDRTETGWGSTGHAFVPADYEAIINKLQEDVETLKNKDTASGGTNPFEGKKIGWIGDSITYGLTPSGSNDVNDRTFFGKMTADALGMSIVNKGIQSSTIARTAASGGNNPMSERYTELDADCDVIVISGGTNDFGKDVALGSISDTANTTFYGALKILCEGLITGYPDKLIIFTTPIKRNDKTVNTNGKTLKEYRNAIIEVCGEYSIPVLDLWAESGLNPSLSAQSGYFSDGLHPTKGGHTLLSRRVIGYFKQLYL